MYDDLERMLIGLKAEHEDDNTTLEVVALLKRKDITVDRASRILQDAQVLIQKITPLN